MSGITLALLMANLLGVVVCHDVAKSRAPKQVIFWTTMGVLFGVLAVPFVLLTRPPLRPG